MTPSLKSPKFAPLVFVIVCMVWLTGHAQPAAAKEMPAQAKAISAAAKELPSSAAALPGGDWVSPLATASAPVKDYQGPLTRFGAGHRGVDYRVKQGQALRSPSAGIIVFGSPVATIPFVSIQHPNGYRTTLSPACTTLPIGTPVLAGQKVAKVCRPDLPPVPIKNPVVTGVKLVLKYLNPFSHCRPQLCLHLSLRHHGMYLSPLSVIDGMKPSRLLR